MPRRNDDHLYNLRKALREQQEQEDLKVLSRKADEAVKKKEDEIRSSSNESYTEHKDRVVKEFNTFKNKVYDSIMENFLTGLFNDSLGNTKAIISEDIKAFNKSLIRNFVMEEGSRNLLDRMSNTSRFTAEMANIMEQKADEAIAAVNPDDPSTYTVDSEEQLNFYDNVDSKDTIEDLTDIIKMRVSRATEDFVEKNLADKMDIKDIMLTAKDKIDNIKSGDEETDDAIAQEATIKMKRAIKETNKRPHNIYEQMVINLTEQIVSNDKLKEKFTNESGRLDMDAIIERCNSFYTMLEMVNTLKIKPMTEDYIKEVIKLN